MCESTLRESHPINKGEESGREKGTFSYGRFVVVPFSLILTHEAWLVGLSWVC